MKYKKLPIDDKKNSKNIKVGHVVRIKPRMKHLNRYNESRGIVGIVFDVHEDRISLRDKNSRNHIWPTSDLRKVYITDADIFLYHTHGHKAVLEELEKREKNRIKKMLKTRKKNKENK